MTLKISKTDAIDGKHLYLGISGFRDKVHRQVILEKIERILSDDNTRTQFLHQVEELLEKR